MAKSKANIHFRSLLAEKILDLGNFAAAALVFGQFISGDITFSYSLVVGLILLVSCYIISYIISKGR